MENKLKLQEKFWIGTYVGLWLIVSAVSTIHSVEFFKLSNNEILSWFLAFAFELGAIASLGGLLISRGSKTLIWILFGILTAFQIHCNMYWAWINADDISQWSQLLSLVDEDLDTQKRIFAVISGGILPVVALGFMKSLMDYLRPDKLIQENDADTDGTIINSDHTIQDPEFVVTKEYVDETIFDNNVEDIEEVEVLITDETTNNPFWHNLDHKKSLKILNGLDDKIKDDISK